MSEQGSTRSSRWSWVVRVVAALALVAVGWVLLTAWAPVVHGHPAYPVLLGLTVVGALVALWRARRARTRRGGWRLAGRVVLVVLAVAWVATMVWLRPFAAVQPALAAMRSDAAVTVTETATSIVLAPRDRAGTAGDLGVFFQPGARVDARAYAAVLRPLAQAGHPVVIAKQPLGIAFLALPAFDAARLRPPRGDPVGGGRALPGRHRRRHPGRRRRRRRQGPGGRPAALRVVPGRRRERVADGGGRVGVRLPGRSRHTREDPGLARRTCRRGASFTVVEGGTHAQFGAYGPQPGDGTATISDDDARRLISTASLRFVDSLQP